MPPISLLSEDLIHTDGVGPSVNISCKSGKLLVLTLGITGAIEQSSLDLTIWGSEDGVNWGSKPLASFPRKFYCGLYSTLLNLAAFPHVRYLRTRWTVSRWRKSQVVPSFSFYVEAEESGTRLNVAHGQYHHHAAAVA